MGQWVVWTRSPAYTDWITLTKLPWYRHIKLHWQSSGLHVEEDGRACVGTGGGRISGGSGAEQAPVQQQQMQSGEA